MQYSCDSARAVSHAAVRIRAQDRIPDLPGEIVGQIEAIDGKGARTSFAGIGELAEALKQPAAKGNATG